MKSKPSPTKQTVGLFSVDEINRYKRVDFKDKKKKFKLHKNLLQSKIMLDHTGQLSSELKIKYGDKKPAPAAKSYK